MKLCMTRTDSSAYISFHRDKVHSNPVWCVIPGANWFPHLNHIAILLPGTTLTSNQLSRQALDLHASRRLMIGYKLSTVRGVCHIMLDFKQARLNL